MAEIANAGNTSLKVECMHRGVGKRKQKKGDKSMLSKQPLIYVFRGLEQPNAPVMLFILTIYEFSGPSAHLADFG